LLGHILKLSENAVAHLGCGRFGKCDGNDLARIFNFGQQRQKAAGEQVSLARTCRGLHKD
jgi:hypothetical protein